MSAGDLWAALPLLWLVTGAFALYLAARLLVGRVKTRNQWLAALTALVLVAALVLLALPARPAAASSTAPPLRAEPGARLIGGLALGLGLCVAVYSGRYLALDRRYETYYPLLLLLVAGILGMVMATDLFGLYMFCELMSVTAYVLVAFRRRTDTAVEAGFKYLVMGSVGTITLLMGIALLYRERGTLALPPALIATPAVAPGAWARAGQACIVAGLGIKSALVPVHTWLPDAHGRAPSSISAMLSGVVIQASLYALLKAALGTGVPARDLGLGLTMLALLNMTVGNVMALVQVHTKRLLAYSTVAQMGYALFGVGVGLRYGLPAAVEAGFFMMLAHAAMKGLAFLSKGVCHFYCYTTLVEELRGTFQRLPLVAVTFTLAALGLVGVPPLAGFAGKWFLLARALHAGNWTVVVGMVIFLANTLLSLGYYLPLVTMLYAPLPAEAETAPIAISPWMIVPLVTLAALVIAMGVAPGPWLRWTVGVLP
jgi:proton-translocating NADH-quinone oxidoreductase chain N